MSAVPQTSRRPPIAGRRPLAGAAALILFTLAATAVGHLGKARTPMPTVGVIAERSLIFKDRADGAVLVYDGTAPDVPIDVIQGPSGFLRGVMRGFARSRHALKIGEEPPFRLVEQSRGRLTLEDPSTGRFAELEAFGPDNAAVFARFLPPPIRQASADR